MRKGKKKKKKSLQLIRWQQAREAHSPQNPTEFSVHIMGCPLPQPYASRVFKNLRVFSTHPRAAALTRREASSPPKSQSSSQPLSQVRFPQNRPRWKSVSRKCVGNALRINAMREWMEQDWVGAIHSRPLIPMGWSCFCFSLSLTPLHQTTTDRILEVAPYNLALRPCNPVCPFWPPSPWARFCLPHPTPAILSIPQGINCGPVMNVAGILDSGMAPVLSESFVSDKEINKKNKRTT